MNDQEASSHPNPLPACGEREPSEREAGEGCRAATAVVFAYHNVGARCLRVLHAHAVDIKLVVTHPDDPSEAQWFARIPDVAADLAIPCIVADDVNAAEIVERIAALGPDFIFSFYCRRMLAPQLLAFAHRGALNMHGSLLPHYRGRAPVNWAVLHGERHTGATLHYMTDKADAGDIVAQQAVPILPDDTAGEVFDKVTLAAEVCLDAAVPGLIAGTAPRIANDVARGSYFGARTPEDGRIDWRKSAVDIHNLVRAVAPPYPGARTTVGGVAARVLRTRVLDADAGSHASTLAVGEPLIARCGGGGSLRIDLLELDGQPVTASELRARFGAASLPLA
ncbi:MAG TPA: formyltransferase [Casimicrobiaceae bacterium]|nr:formyltransferase [Casimicrobiaceae bacterium]